MTEDGRPLPCIGLALELRRSCNMGSAAVVCLARWKGTSGECSEDVVLIPSDSLQCWEDSPGAGLQTTTLI